MRGLFAIAVLADNMLPSACLVAKQLRFSCPVLPQR